MHWKKWYFSNSRTFNDIMEVFYKEPYLQEVVESMRSKKIPVISMYSLCVYECLSVCMFVHVIFFASKQAMMHIHESIP